MLSTALKSEDWEYEVCLWKRYTTHRINKPGLHKGTRVADDWQLLCLDEDRRVVLTAAMHAHSS